MGAMSYFQDTLASRKGFGPRKFSFVAREFPCGETGALWGSFHYAGRTKEAWEELRPIFEAIAAKVEDVLVYIHWT